jgi:hypothetical protein
MRAFIFSLDAFVAFTLALIAIYSLIFFSSIPSSYYYLLTQGHFLSRDVLMALSSTTCAESDCASSGSILDNLASDKMDPSLRTDLVRKTLGKMIPVQFGYTLESVDSRGTTLSAIYDTATDDALLPTNEQHAKVSKKLSISAEVMTFGYSSTYNKPSTSTYSYLSCNANGEGSAGLVTCGSGGNTNPSQTGNGDLVPRANVKVMKLTIFI